MKQRLLLLVLAALGLNSCAGPPPPDADFAALRRQLLSVPPLVPLLMLLLLLASCSIKPTAILPDGTKISVGGSALTKSTSEASVAEATTKDGTHVRLTYTSTGLDETAVPNAKIGADLAKGVADDTTRLGVVSQRQITARGTPITTTTPTGTAQSVSYPPQPVNVPTPKN